MSPTQQAPLVNKRVLSAATSPDDIDDLAAEEGWLLTNVLPDGPRRPAQRIFTTADGETVVYFVADGRLGVTYAASGGAEPAAALERVEVSLACHDPAERHALLEADDLDAFRVGLALLALTQPDLDATERAILDERLSSGDATVRGAVLTAITYAPWSAVETLVQRVADTDPEPALRQTAAQILAALFRK